MRKFTFLFCIVALAALSCKKEEQGGSDEPAKAVITARFADTKVSYSVESDCVKPAWVKDDWIVGFDDNTKTATLVVRKIDASGVATLDGRPSDGNYHLISEVNCTESKIIRGVYTVSYTQQSGDEVKITDVFVSEGSIAGGSGDFTFNRAGGIIALCNAKGMENLVFNKVEIFGENLSEGEVALNASGKLELKAKTKSNDSFNVDGLKVSVSATDAALDAPVILGIPAGAKIDKISLSNSADTYSYEFPVSREVVAGDCIMVKDLAFERPKGEAAAAIGEAKYPTVEDAFAAANAASSAVTVKLLKNAFLAKTIEITNTTAAVSIDLAGFIVSSGEVCFNLVPGAKFTVSDTGKGGAISSDGNNAIMSKGAQVNVVSGSVMSTMKTIYAEEGSEVNISGGSVTATDSCAVVLLFSKGTISGNAEISSTNPGLASKATQDNCQFGTVAVLRSDLDMTGGQINGKGPIGLYISGKGEDVCTVNISGGTINGKYCTVFPYYRSTVNITGGYINQTYSSSKTTLIYSCVYCKNTGGVKINITGGYFKTSSPFTIRSGGEASSVGFNIMGGKYNVTPEAYQYIKLTDEYTIKNITEGDYIYEVVKK